MAARSLPSVGAHGGLTRYLEEIRQFPMLEPQQEYMLAKSWREHGDRDAAHQLVTSHLRLVARIAMGYRGYGLPIGEVVSEGKEGIAALPLPFASPSVEVIQIWHRRQHEDPAHRWLRTLVRDTLQKRVLD